MSVKTVRVNGWHDDLQFNSSGAFVAGIGGPPLSDGNPVTWIQNDSPGVLDYNVRIAALPDYTAGDQILLHFAVSLETVGHVGVATEVFLYLQDGNPTDTSGSWLLGQFTNNASYGDAGVLPSILDGTVYNLVWLYHPRPSGTGSGYGVAGKTLNDALAVLASGDAWLNVNALRPLDGTLIQGRIYEAWLEVGVESTIVPLYPLRRYPPINNGGSGPTRHYPRAVNRRAGGTY